jgi:hypothetical protein
LSKSYKKLFEKKYTLIEKNDKYYPGKPYNENKKSYIIEELENRDFEKGEATFWEFISIKDLKERYIENIVNYIIKTFVAKFTPEEINEILTKDNKIKIIQKIAIESCVKYTLKDILNSIDYPKNNSKAKKLRKNVETIRKVGQVYTFSYSTFTLPFKLYQENYTKLKNLHKKYGFYYNADKDYELGRLIYRNNEFHYNSHKSLFKNKINNA